MLALLVLCLQDPVELEAVFDNGLHFRTPDRSIDLTLGGRLRIQEREILDRPDDDLAPVRSSPDGPFIRLARIEIGGVVREDWSFRLQLDTATGSGMTVRDAWLEWRPAKELAFRAGQYFEPCSAEDMGGSRLLEFIERSAGNRLAPGRQTGLQVRGDVAGNLLSYYVMLAQGNALLSDQGRSVPDADDEKELAGIVFVRPVPQVRLGAGGSLADVDSVDAAAFDLVSTELSVLWLDSTAGTFDGRRSRGSLSVQASLGPAGLRAEVLDRRDELDGGGEIRSTSGTVSASCLLTGESKDFEKPLTPIREWGALEISLRYARVRLREVFSEGLASAAGNSDEATVWTAGFDWHPVRNLRLSLNAIREDYGDPLEFDRGGEDSLTGFLARVQLDF